MYLLLLVSLSLGFSSLDHKLLLEVVGFSEFLAEAGSYEPILDLRHPKLSRFSLNLDVKIDGVRNKQGCTCK